MIRAGMDIGTNTFLLLVAEVDAGKVRRVLRDETRIVRLGQGVDQAKAFHPDAMDRGKKVFAEYGAILKSYPGISFRAVATSGSRDATNSAQYFSEMQGLLGFPVEVISGEEEARLSFLGALSDHENPEDYAVIDIGGGSTEIVACGENSGQKKSVGSLGLVRKSFNIGCVRMTERFLKLDPPSSAEMEEVREFVRSILEQERGLLEKFRSKRWLGVAGTATYLSAAALGLKKFEAERIHGSILRKLEIAKLIDGFSRLASKERLGLGGMDSGRADVILGGAIVLEEFLRAAHAESLEISVRGLRYGLVL